MDGQREALRRVAAGDPALAARLVLMTLPAAAARIPGELAYVLDVHGVERRRVSVSGGRASVSDPDVFRGDGGAPPRLPPLDRAGHAR